MSWRYKLLNILLLNHCFRKYLRETKVFHALEDPWDIRSVQAYNFHTLPEPSDTKRHRQHGFLYYNTFTIFNTSFALELHSFLILL